MFYFLLSAAIQKNREYLALALCCLVIALRNQFFFAEHLLSADYDFYLEYRLVVLDVSLIPASARYLLSAFYRKALRPRSLAVFAAAVAVLTALHPPLVPAGASAGAAGLAHPGRPGRPDGADLGGRKLRLQFRGQPLRRHADGDDRVHSGGAGDLQGHHSHVRRHAGAGLHRPRGLLLPLRRTEGG